MSLASPYQEHYYVADGVTTSFSFGEYFTGLSQAYVKCIIYFDDGTNCVPTFTVDMTTGFITIVTLTKPDGTVLTVPPAGSIVRVFRDTPEQQNVTASQLQNYTAKQLERIFDSVVAMIQEVSYSDLHKTIRLTETQRDVSMEQLKEENDQAILYWDFETRQLKATDYGQNQVVKSDTVDRLVYLQPEGKIYFIPKGSNNPIAIGSATIHNDLGGRNAPDCHPESAITNLTTHLQELRDADTALAENVQTALNRSQEAKDTADEAKETAEYAQTIAGQAKDIAEDAKETAEGIEGIAQEALDNSEEALDKVTQEITDREDADEDLQDQIDSLSGRGRFLALWNCATGLAESNPPESPYPYKAGDYFVVGTVSSADPAVNYKPDGSSYTTGVASTTVETNEVSVNDTYFYDGTVWKLQSNAQKEVSFSALAGSPYDNTNLSNALNAKQGTLTAGTNITIDANNVISSTAQESFFRGVWLAWTTVPTDTSSYPEDYHSNKVPKNNDYMVIEDASSYVNPDFTNDPENTTFIKTSASVYSLDIVVGSNRISTYYTDFSNVYKTIRELFEAKGVPGVGCTWLSIKYILGSPGWWALKATNDYFLDNVQKTSSTETLFMNTSESAGTTHYTSKDAGVAPIPLSGSWRFYYNGVWSTDGKSGWKPQYQIENVLPIADSSTLGIAKLYNTTGNNTDGSMTQKSVTDALSAKQDNISDLATIRSGAALGATAVQPGDLATVATTGDYDDLLNKPTIPTVNNPTITITQGGVTKGSFTLNQASGDTIALDAGGGSSYTAGSGIDITSNTISVTSPTLTNNTTQTNSLAIFGTTTGVQGVTIGVSATAVRNSVVIGYSASSVSYGIAIGYNAKTLYSTSAYPCIAIGASAVTGTNVMDAIQIGTGTNSTSKSMQVWSYTLLDKNTGTIPEARLADTTSALAGQVLTLDANLDAVWANAGGSSYTAGNGIDITSDVISVDDLDCGTM